MSKEMEEDIFIDIKTINWGIRPNRFSFNEDHVLYSARLRLVDSRFPKVIADEICNYPDNNSSETTYDELLENNAEKIKQELNKASIYCIKSFKENVFSM